MATRVLLVEEGSANAAAVADMLMANAPGEFLVEHVSSTAEATLRLGDGGFDAILLDVGTSAADYGGLRALVVASPDLPVVVLTETGDEDVGTAAVQAGAQDYLVKSRINGDVLRRVIRYSRERIRVKKDVDGLARQIAERQNMEAALRESQHRFQAITESLFEGVLVVDSTGDIVFSNRSADKLLGDGADADIAGRNIDSVFTLMDGKRPCPFAESPFRRVAESGQVLRYDEAVFQTRGGRPLMVAYACSPFVEGGALQGSIISFRDIQALKKAQQEALQASKLASVGQLAAGIAHEINTPTQYIGDNLRFLGDAFGALVEVVRSWRAAIDGPTPDSDARAALRKAFEDADVDYLIEEIPRAVSQSLEGVGQVARIVLAMKEFSHPGEREKVSIDLNRAVENTIAVSRNEWKHLADLSADLDPDLPAVTCLPGEVNQVLLNLVVNAAHAIEFTKRRGKGRIAISTRRRGAFIDIVVADDGVGMTDEVKERIFDPFFTTKGVGKGTGQGLAICRDVVVAKHGGAIVVESEEGKGARFIVSLPINGTGAHGEATQ